MHYLQFCKIIRRTAFGVWTRQTEVDVDVDDDDDDDDE